MQYKVIRSDFEMELSKSVEEHLRDGWRLQGGVSIASLGMTVYLAQALVR